MLVEKVEMPFFPLIVLMAKPCVLVIHCSVFGEVLIHVTSSASEGAQALDIYVNRLID
jgi:hypothetical protein